MVAARNNTNKSKKSKEAEAVALDSNFNLADFEDFDLSELEEMQGQPVDLSQLPILQEQKEAREQIPPAPSSTSSSEKEKEREVNPHDNAPDEGATRYPDLITGAGGAEPAKRRGGVTPGTLAGATPPSQAALEAEAPPSKPPSSFPALSAAVGTSPTPPTTTAQGDNSEGLPGAGLVAIPSEATASAHSSASAEGQFATLGRVVRIPVALLVDNPYQYRRNVTAESVADLVADFTTRGLAKALQSIPKVKRWRKAASDPTKPNETSVQYVLSSGGHRRLTAWKLAFPGEAFPVYLEEGEVSEEELADGAIVENLMRRDPGEVEYALAFAALIARFGYRQNQIATRYGMDITQISRYLSLLDLPSSLQEENAKGRLPMRLGAYLARYKDVPQVAEYFYQLYQQQNYSVAFIENQSVLLLADSPLSSEVKEAALAVARPHKDKDRNKGKDETSVLVAETVPPQPMSPTPAIKAETETENSEFSEVANYPAYPSKPDKVSEGSNAVAFQGQLASHPTASQFPAQTQTERDEIENEEAEVFYADVPTEKPVPVSASLPVTFDAEFDLSLANSAAALLPTENEAHWQDQDKAEENDKIFPGLVITTPTPAEVSVPALSSPPSAQLLSLEADQAVATFGEAVHQQEVEEAEEEESESESQETEWTGGNWSSSVEEDAFGAVEEAEEEEAESYTAAHGLASGGAPSPASNAASEGAVTLNGAIPLTSAYPSPPAPRLPQTPKRASLQFQLPKPTRNRSGKLVEYEEVLSEFLMRLDPAQSSDQAKSSEATSALLEFEETNPEAAALWQMALVFAILQAEGEVVEQVIRENWLAISDGSTSAPRQQELEQPWLWVATLWPEMTLRLLVEILARHWHWEQQEIFEGVNPSETAFGWLLNQLKATLMQKKVGMRTIGA